MDGSSIENCLCQLVEMQSKAFMDKYLSRVTVRDEASVLYGLPQEAVQAEFEKLASDSAAYIVFRKCGIPTDIFTEAGAFENISHFGSLEMFMGLGYYATAIAKPVLMEIHKQIEAIKEERSHAYEQRTISETGISGRERWSDVSQSPDIGGQGTRPEGDRAVREPVKGLHEGETPAETVRTDRLGQEQRGALPGGRGGRNEIASNRKMYF